MCPFSVPSLPCRRRTSMDLSNPSSCPSSSSHPRCPRPPPVPISAANPVSDVIKCTLPNDCYTETLERRRNFIECATGEQFCFSHVGDSRARRVIDRAGLTVAVNVFARTVLLGGSRDEGDQRVLRRVRASRREKGGIARETRGALFVDVINNKHSTPAVFHVLRLKKPSSRYLPPPTEDSRTVIAR